LPDVPEAVVGLRYGDRVTRPFRPLGPEDAIGVVALSGPVDGEQLDRGLQRLRACGRRVELAPNLRHRRGYLAGTDDERLAGLDAVLDAGARTVIAARGGYGITRLLPRLPWDRLVEGRVRFVGFSDLTALLLPLVDRGGAVQIHGPMVASGLDDQRSARRLLDVLEGRLVGSPLFTFGAARVVRHGQAIGIAKGGNLSLLASLVGTPWQPDLRGSVVFLEDVAEPAYRLDRMLTHLRASGIFRGVKALICGTLCDCGDLDPLSREWRELLEEVAPEIGPVVTGLEFGHGTPNLAFPIGTHVTVDTASGRVDWSG
jgi:muramoyltetrapeptide carboxypeptidase